MKSHESGETYLETILLLTRKLGSIRSIDVASELGYSKPSVSRAVNILKEHGYIIIEKPGYIILTEKGRKKAEDIFERHLYITKFLAHALEIGDDLAEQDACRIEHILSEETFAAVKRYMEKNGIVF